MTGPSEQPPKSNAPVIAPTQQSHASWPVHLELPTILTHSASLPTNQASRPTRPIPSPAPATMASPVVPPTTPLRPQPSLPSRLMIRIPSINPDAPQMIPLGVRGYGNRCLHVRNIAGFGRKFLQCSDQIHFIHISHVTSTFASNVITNNISFTFEM